jgi:transposase
VRNASAEERLGVRQERSRRIAERFKRWIDQEILWVLPESPMGQAMRYTISNWEALTRFLDSGSSLLITMPLKELCARS